jgi:hypothetical protein
MQQAGPEQWCTHAHQERAMLETPSLSLPSFAGPQLYSAMDLCRAMHACAERPVQLDAGSLDRVLRHDAERGLIEVQAGAPWLALAAFGVGQFAPGSVGDSVAANAPGPDGRPLVAHLRSLTMVTADGEMRRVNRELSPELFALAVGGFGAFGPFYSVTLDLGSMADAVAHAVAPVRLPLQPAGPGSERFGVELLVPPESSDALMEEVRAALQERRYELSHLLARRTLPESETYLRWARREYASLRIEYRARATLGAHVAAAQLRSRLIGLALAAGGGFAPAELAHASRAHAACAYPMLGAFLAEKRRFDPAERILNPWYRRARHAWRGERCDVRWARG